MVVAELLCIFSSAASVTLWYFQYNIGRVGQGRCFFYIASWLFPTGVLIYHNTMKEGGMKDFLMMCQDKKLGYLTESKVRNGLMFAGYGITTILQILNLKNLQ
jgi:hypothetical protein